MPFVNPTGPVSLWCALFKATGDPYYLDVGKSIMDSLERYARVQCGYAALKDVTTGGHEDRSALYPVEKPVKATITL